MMLRRRGMLRIAELWFEEEPEGASLDIAKFMWSTRPFPGAEVRHTLWVDLLAGHESLWKHINAEGRRQIRKAEADPNLVFHPPAPPTSAEVQAFLDCYNAFAASKGLEPLGPEDLDTLVAHGRLHLSSIRDAQGSLLVWHSYYVDGRHARLLHSASHFRTAESSEGRNRVGLANRFLHWKEFLFYAESGYGVLDLGGWASGTTDEALLGINRFKASLGGTLREIYIGRRPRSLRGRLALGLQSLFKRLP